MTMTSAARRSSASPGSRANALLAAARRGGARLLVVAGALCLCGAGGTRPPWQPGQHPRLLATAGEKAAITARLQAPGTVANAVWTAFRGEHRGAASYVDYADGAVLYWIDGDQAAGQQAIQHAFAHVAKYPAGITPDSSTFNEDWYAYRDLLLTYDFAYDLLTEQQKKQLLAYIARQGARCVAAGPGYSAGNIHLVWVFCAAASAVMMEGEGYALDVVDEPVVRGPRPDTADPLGYPIDAGSIKVTNRPNTQSPDYVLGVDFNYAYFPGVCARCINWSPSGGNTKEPAPGTTYYVSYRFTPDVALWKVAGRTGFENHLSYHWHDGAYNGGINPYGALVAEYLTYLIELYRRDTAIDYGRNEDVKRLVDAYIYTRLPGTPRRFDTVNDSANWTVVTRDAWTYPMLFARPYRAWLRPFVAWAIANYRTDPEGYGERYHWLWMQAYRDDNGALSYTPDPDWREAWWIDSQVIGAWPNANAPRASFAKSRYFRGKELVYVRTGPWDAPDDLATVASFSAGPHNYLNEHDHGDSGSFTFYSLGEDWVVDPGYGYYALADHNTVDIDRAGFPSLFGGFAHFEGVALSDDASALDEDLGGAWSLTATPAVKRDHRYAVLVNGGEPSYLVLGDDVDKDGGAHAYQLYLHTGPGNQVQIAGNRATVAGARTGATMEVHSLGPAPVVLSQATAKGDIGAHAVITAQASGVDNPRFLHLLLPAGPQQTAPSVASAGIAGGTRATVTHADGTVDSILWRHGAAGTVQDGPLASDGKLTVVRVANGAVAGLAVIDARTVTWNGGELMAALDGAGPATVAAFGATAAVRATDVSRLRLRLPFVKAVTLEDGKPIASDAVGGARLVNGGLPLAEMRRGAGVRYAEDFSDGYADWFFRFDLSRSPVEQFRVIDGAYELRATPWDWPSISRRDSTPWRREAIYPNVVPPLDHGDARFDVRFAFAATADKSRRLFVHLRTRDRNPVDWATDQDYVRIEIAPGLGTVTLGQRVAGDAKQNDALTRALGAVPVAIDDTAPHALSVTLEGSAARVVLDGATLYDVPAIDANVAPPAVGYVQWKVTGASPVSIDDLVVSALDRTRPVAPTSGTLMVDETGAGPLVVRYDDGVSTDAEALVLYQSDRPIEPADDPKALLELASTKASIVTLAATGVDRAKYQAASVRDARGNASLLLPLRATLGLPDLSLPVGAAAGAVDMEGPPAAAGCGCRVAARPSSRSWPALLAVALALAARPRRRRA